MEIGKFNQMKAYLLKPKRFFTKKQDTIGGGTIQGENLGSRSGFSSPEAIKYLKGLKPGTTVNTYEIGKRFNVAPATVRGQVERNFPQLKLQTIEEGAAKAKETRRAQYAEKTSDVPIIQTEVKGKGAEARTKGRNIIGVKFPNKELENKYIEYMKDRYSGVKGRKGPSNKELAIEFYGDDTSASEAKIEKINQYYKKNLNLKFEKAPPDEVKEKRTRRLAITQGGKTFTGTDKIPFHHIMPIGGEVDLTTKDVAFITKEMNSKLAPYNTKLNDIADAISNQLNNQEPGYLDRIDELNKQAEQIVESAKIRLPKKFQNYIGFNRLDPILDEYGTPIRLNVTRVGVDDSKSLAGKKGEAIKLETLTQKSLEDYAANRNKFKKLLFKEFCGIGGARQKNALGGRIGFADGTVCSPETVAKGMQKSIQAGDSAKVLKALKQGTKLLGNVVAPIDVAIEGAFALPYLLEGDLEGAKQATTLGFFGWGKDLQEQVGDRFGENSPAFGALEKQRAIDLQVEGMFDMDQALLRGEKSGIFIKDEKGDYTQKKDLTVSEQDSLKAANSLFKTGAEKTLEARNLFTNAAPKILGPQNESTALSQLGVFSDEVRSGVLNEKINDPSIMANLFKSLNISQPAERTVEGFISTGGLGTEFPLASNVKQSELIQDRINRLKELRIADLPLDIAAQVPAYEKAQMPPQEELDMRLRQNLGIADPQLVQQYEQMGFPQLVPFLPSYANGGRIGFKKGFGIFKGLPGIQLGRIEKELIKKYKREDAERSLLDIIKQSNEEANQIVNKRKLDYINDLMEDTNILDEKYVNLIDEEIRINDPELFKTIKQFEANERPALADKMRALRHPDWAEANYGEDYMSALEQGQVREINKMMDDLPDVQERTLVDDIDDMNKANIDEIMGRKKNAIGGRITFASGGRMSYAEGPEDPSKRKFLKNVGIGGGIAGGFMTGLLNLVDLFKGGKKGVVATKAAESEAEKIFFDLVDVVKNKGILKRLDDPSELKQGEIYEYKGVKVLEDGENIEVRFTTDKGAPAVVEYRKPGYEVDPDAGTSQQVPGEFIYEAQETARYGPDGDVEMDFVEEVIDPIENIKDMAKEKK